MAILLAPGNAPVAVLCDGLTIVNAGPGTAYYGKGNVSPTSSDGSIAPGGSASLGGTQFFVTSGSRAELSLIPSAPRGLSYIDARDYGVRADGRYVVDLVTTTNNAVVTSASANFRSGDIGKLILIMRAGTSNVSFSSTILSVQSSTQATLAANVPVAGTNPAWFGSDDTTAVQASIDAAFGINGNGLGDVLLPNGMIMIGGALRNTATTGRTSVASDYKYNAQLVIPAWDQVSDLRVQLRIRGSMPAGAGIGGGSSGGPYFGPIQGTSLISTLTTASIDATYKEPSILGGPTTVVPNGPFGMFTNVGVILENLRIFAPMNPQLGAVDLQRVTHAKIKECMIGTTMLPGQPGAGIPTIPRSFALRMPVVYSNSPSCVRDTFIYGFYVGLLPGEHTVMDNVNIFTAEVGLAPFPNAAHACWGGYVMTEFLNHAIAGWDSSTGVTDIQADTYMDITTLDTEVNTLHIKDASHHLRGRIGIMNNGGSTAGLVSGAGNCVWSMTNGAKLPFVQNGGGGSIPVFALSGRPAAGSVSPWGIIAVIDAAAGSKLQYSDGSAWQSLG